MINIAHNIEAMNAQRIYNINISDKQKSTEKLSSGYRINRAADDAAGLTISEKMRSLIRALNQGSENTQDGISWIQVADGAMAEGHDMIHRLRELAVKAANGTNTDEDRYALNEEAQSILDEFHRIDLSTQFNTKDVFSHGSTRLEIEGEPGDLEVFDSVSDDGTVTYGGFIFHGERIRFDQMNPPDMVRMENGQQVFNGNVDGKSYSYTNSRGEFFNVYVKDGDPVPEAKRVLTIDAHSDSALYIDGYEIDWSKVTDENGRGVSSDNLHAGKWSVSYGSAKVSFYIGNNVSLRNMSEFASALENTSDMDKNGGTSYKWVTYLDDLYERSAVNATDGVFEDMNINGFPFNRVVDNVMAYKSDCDTYSDKSSAYMGYSLRAQVVKKSENKSVVDDIRNDGSKTTGMDAKDQDVKLYLIGTDRSKVVEGGVMNDQAIAGTEILLSQLTRHPITSWTNGEDITDGDNCPEHGGVTNPYNKDGITDYYYEYKDPSGKTDISFLFTLSDVASADTIAINILSSPTNRSEGLNNTKFNQSFSSTFVDAMSVVANDKVSIINPGSKEYGASYDSNVILGRDFDSKNYVLASINGTTPGNEGLIEYSNHKFKFSVAGEGKAAGDKDNFDSVAKNVNDIPYMTFSADTTKQEAAMRSDVYNAGNTVLTDKINYVLKGNTDSGSTDTAYKGSTTEKITISDSNIYEGTKQSNNTNSSRTYQYGYEYADIVETINTGNDAAKTGAQMVTVKMSSGTAYSSSANTSNMFLQLKTDYTQGAENYKAGYYILASDLTGDIDNVYSTINTNMTKAGVSDRYVYNSFNSLKDEFVKESEYKGLVQKAVDDAINGASVDGKNYTVVSGGTIKETDTLKTETEGYFDTLINNVLDDLLSKVKTTGFYEKDSDGNPLLDVNGDKIPLSGEALQRAITENTNSILGNIQKNFGKVLNKDAIAGLQKNNSSLTTDEIAKRVINSAESIISSIDFSALSADSEGAFDLSSSVPSAGSGSAADKAKTLANSEVTAISNAKYTANVQTFLDKLSCSDDVKALIKSNMGTAAVKGSFTMDKTTLKGLFNSTTIATNATKKAIALGSKEAISAGKAPSSSDLKAIVLSNLQKSISAAGFSSSKEKLSDEIKNYVNNNWSSVEGDIVAANGYVKFGTGFQNKIKELVVGKYTNNELKSIETYYGGVRVDDVVQVTKKKDPSTGRLVNDYNAASAKSKISEAAKNYVEKIAFPELAKYSSFTLEAKDYAATHMSTVHPYSMSRYAEYYSDLEIETKEKLRIQHSNILDDYTEINKFSFDTAVLGITNLNLSTERKSRKALDRLDKALDYISSKRSDLGATQNRLEATYRNNRNKEENLTAAESRIRDTDMASEMVKNSKHSILIQVGQSMMAQANQNKQGILSLIS